MIELRWFTSKPLYNPSAKKWEHYAPVLQWRELVANGKLIPIANSEMLWQAVPMVVEEE